MKIKNILPLISILPTTILAADLNLKSTDIASAPNFIWYTIGAAFTIGISVLGGTIAQGRAAAAAMEGIARNPNAADKIFVPMILVMALIESLVLFGLIIAFILVGKLN